MPARLGRGRLSLAFGSSKASWAALHERPAFRSDPSVCCEPDCNVVLLTPSNADVRPFDLDEAGPSITPDTSTRVEWSRSKVLHHLPLELTPLVLIFPDSFCEQVHELRYVLYAENLQKPTEGILKIVTQGSPGLLSRRAGREYPCHRFLSRNQAVSERVQEVNNMSDLMSEVPEASAFLEEVIDNASAYRLFPDERFVYYLGGIIATSEVDLQRDRLTGEALVHLAQQINGAPIWNLAEHDPLVHTIGRSLAARVFYAPISGVYFVAAVTGVYDSSDLPRFADLGIDPDTLAVPVSTVGDYQSGAVQARLAVARTDLDQAALQNLMSGRPDAVDSLVSDRTRKAADPLTI